MAATFKNFLHVSDFYNWIKKSTGENVPTNFYWFSVYFFLQHKN